MSLSASMWTGVSGLLGHGEKLNVVGNNIANVSTVGFKAQRMDFEDYMYTSAHTASGTSQIGRGVGVGIIMGDFSGGALESTTSAIDLAISGQGFFKVQPIGSEQAYFTRAGNFQFNVDGYLVDPHGYAVQGWKIDNSSGPSQASGGSVSAAAQISGIRGSGVPTDVRLDSWTVPPKQTTKTSVITNLSAEGSDSSKNPGNPFASLIQAWDGTQPPPIADKPAIAEVSYAYSTSIKVYDESGLPHTLTVYYDKVADESYEGNEGETMWEYMVTMDPAEDKRQVWDATAGQLVDVSSTKAAGILMSGVMTFGPGGDMLNQTAYTLMGNLQYATDAMGNAVPDADGNYTWAQPGPPIDESKGLVPVVTDLNSTNGILDKFYPATVSQTGYPILVANFNGQPSANTSGSPSGEKYFMEFNLGMKVGNLDNPWSVPDNTSLLSASRAAQNNGILGEKNQNHKYAPKIVEYRQADPANPLASDYNKACSDAYIAALRAEASGDPSKLDDWEDEWVTIPGVSLADALMSTWPYEFDPSYTPADIDFGDIKKGGFNPDSRQNQSAIYDYTPKSEDIGFMNNGVREANTTKMQGKNYSTANGTGQNGYTFGNLTGYDVDADGILYGVYSNGVTMGLYQLTLYDFTCHQGLRREGGNLYSQTMDSGEAFFGAAQTNGMGKINSYSLEQSNVDMAREFVQMISTQRGFQANSKVITTTDTMLETVVSMKR